MATAVGAGTGVAGATTSAKGVEVACGTVVAAGDEDVIAGRDVGAGSGDPAPAPPQAPDASATAVARARTTLICIAPRFTYGTGGRNGCLHGRPG